VIELLLQAERALSMGMVDQAERMYRQAADADPRNSIAVVGLARVALEHADDAGALRLARRALAIDPENVAAVRLTARLEEVLTYRGEPLPGSDEPSSAVSSAPEPAALVSSAPEPSPAVSSSTTSPSDPSASEPSAATSPVDSPATQPHPPVTPRRSPLDRLLRRNRP
jgi:tetratricopeptide (TPR) repeat protein